jgi:hypothetical protein
LSIIEQYNSNEKEIEIDTGRKTSDNNPICINSPQEEISMTMTPNDDKTY